MGRLPILDKFDGQRKSYLKRTTLPLGRWALIKEECMLWEEDHLRFRTLGRNHRRGYYGRRTNLEV